MPLYILIIWSYACPFLGWLERKAAHGMTSYRSYLHWGIFEWNFPSIAERDSAFLMGRTCRVPLETCCLCVPALPALPGGDSLLCSLSSSIAQTGSVWMRPISASSPWERLLCTFPLVFLSSAQAQGSVIGTLFHASCLACIFQHYPHEMLANGLYLKPSSSYSAHSQIS